jgi:uncharacterized protein with gpF-like domain
LAGLIPGRKSREADRFWKSLKRPALDIVIPVFTEIYMGGVEAALRTARAKRPKKRRGSKATAVAADLRADAIAARAQDYINGYANEWWDQLAAQTRTKLANKIVNAHDQGLALEDIIADVSTLFGSNRAELISITETTRLFGAAAQDTYGALGFSGWDWNTVNDDAVDEICSDMESGSPYPMSQDFEPAHPGCRCWPTPAEG